VTKPQSTTTTVIIVTSVVIAIVIVALVFGVLVTNRKRAYGTTWFPEGFRSVFRQRPATNDLSRYQTGSFVTFVWSL